MSGGEELKSKSPNLYQELLTGPHDSQVTDIIKTDLPRTFPDNIFFNNTDRHQRQLYNILLAFAHQNRQVGYCQVRILYFSTVNCLTFMLNLIIFRD